MAEVFTLVSLCSSVLRLLSRLKAPLNNFICFNKFCLFRKVYLLKLHVWINSWKSNYNSVIKWNFKSYNSPSVLNSKHAFKSYKTPTLGFNTPFQRYAKGFMKLVAKMSETNFRVYYLELPLDKIWMRWLDNIFAEYTKQQCCQ